MKKIIAVLLACFMAAACFAPTFCAQEEGKSSPCGCWGDMDGDKSVTSADARLVLRQSVGLEDYPEDALYRCDLDSDGCVSSADARFVLRLSVNLESFPGHEAVPVVGRDATCTEDGLTDGLYCVICEQELETQKAIPAPGHKEVVDQAIEATCTKDGLTEGKHCEVCGAVFTEQKTVPALGHAPAEKPASSADVCRKAQICERCGEELSPELKHDVAANATVTAEKGIVCKRCNQTVVPSFNELVNALKKDEHTYRHFSRTDTNISDPKMTGIMVFFKREFEDEFNNNTGAATEYISLSEKTELNNDTFELFHSDAVSLLTDADLASEKTETIKGVDFLKDLPDTFTGTYGRVSDLRDLKSKQIGDVLKVTVTLQPERYSEWKDKGGVKAIDKISFEYGAMIITAMEEFSSLDEGFLKCECDSVSSVSVAYYFDKETLRPIAALYHLNMDMDQTMIIDVTGLSGDRSQIPLSLGNTGSISFDVTTDVHSYYFFDEYFD